MKADQLRAERCREAQFEAQMVVVNKIIEDMNMTNKLTTKQVIGALASFGCQVKIEYRGYAQDAHWKIDAPAIAIVQAITSLIEAATFDANIECGKSIERQKYWRNRSVEASTELSEAWGDYAAMKIERDELRQQLAAAQNDVKQLRQSLDKRAGQSVVSTLKIEVDTSKPKTEMQRIGESLMQASKAFASINSHQSAADKADNDGWIAWHGDSTPPIKNGIAHQVKFHCGQVSDIDFSASTWAWGRKSGVGGYTIIAYRLIK